MGIITDPIADMLIRIKNANQRKHKIVNIPYSKVKKQITSILKMEGFIVDYTISGENITKKIVIILKYKGNQKAITGVKKISKPGLKVYATVANVPRVLSGFGTAIISTSKGMITDRKARKENVGGEVIAYIW